MSSSPLYATVAPRRLPPPDLDNDSSSIYNNVVAVTGSNKDITMKSLQERGSNTNTQIRIRNK